MEKPLDPTPSSSSSSYGCSSNQVFLSFRAEDSCCVSFTDHLYTALVQAGFQTFKQDTDTRKEQPHNAIRESKVSLIVLSEGYAFSQSCLDQLDVILTCKEKLDRAILPVFYYVDPSDVRKKKGRIGEALAFHEQELKWESSGRERVERWRQALAKVADLGGMVLHNQARGHESKFIRKIVNVVTNRLSRTALYVAPYLIGIDRRAKHISFWLQNGSADVGTLIVCGMGGIGKTTLAKFIYNSNFHAFEGSSFVLNIREISKQPNGLVKLQKQILSDILKRTKERVSCVDEGIVKISDALSGKRVLLVLDDVDDSDQLNAVLGMKSLFYPGSKIIITTRHERILNPHLVDKVYTVETLSTDESLELFSWHAFGKPHPVEGFLECSNEVVKQCGGIPLALRVLGSSLAGQNLDIWQSTIKKLQVVPNNRIIELLKISYESLEDDDRSLFLHIACFFLWEDKDFAVEILDKCELFTMVGIQNLIDRDLLSILNGRLFMHQLIQDLGREIVRQESVKEPGRRSRLWRHEESLYVLRNKTGTEAIEGIILDGNMRKGHGSTRIISNENYGKKSKVEEFMNNSQEDRPKQNWVSIFSRHIMGTREVPNEDLETDSFTNMHKLKFLLLSNIQLSGCYKKFPKKLRWLFWRYLQLESLPSDFPMGKLVAIDLCYSSLKQLWTAPKGYYCNGVFSTFLSGEHVPSCFDTKLSEPFCSSFIVPTPDNHRIRGLSFCLVYTCLESEEMVSEGHCLSITINNLLQRIKWKQDPIFLAIPEVEERMMWLSYWEIGNSLQTGDVVEISASVGDKQRFSINEVGMRILFLEEQQDQDKESNCEVEEFFSSPCHQNLLLVRVFPM